jgi:hypothetical protein
VTHSHFHKLATITQLPQPAVETRRFLPQAQLLAAKAATNPTCKAPQLPGTGSLALSSINFLSLPSDPAVTSDALASRILFPVNRVRTVTSTDWVCQLRWANKKGTVETVPSLYQSKFNSTI